MKAFSGSVSCVSLFALPFFVPEIVKAVLVFISARFVRMSQAAEQHVPEHLSKHPACLIALHDCGSSVVGNEGESKCAQVIPGTLV